MQADTKPDWLQNHTFDELQPGQTACLRRRLSEADIAGFAAISGDLNPTHLDEAWALQNGLQGRTAHGMWSGALISTLLGTVMPGPGTRYVSQDMRFLGSAASGDLLLASATVVSKDWSNGEVTLDCNVRHEDGTPLMTGRAVVIAPRLRCRVPRAGGLRWHVFDAEAGLRQLVERARSLPQLRCAVVQPADGESLKGALEAARNGLFEPVLVGETARLRAAAEQAGLDISGVALVDVADAPQAADTAARMAAEGQVQALMKGSLHTDELIRAVLSRPELRSRRRLSHVFRFDVPMYHKPLYVTDAAINVAPTLAEKADILANALDLVRALGESTPKAALLAAVENVNPKMACTVDAAALCKMVDRGSFGSADVDGPLAFDNAISQHAAHIKGIRSSVSGDADILMVPDLVSGNILAKQLEYLAGATGCGLVVGARLPIALTSRADGASARLASAALAVIAAHHQPGDHHG